jgi:hypothetical protein
MLYLTLNDIIWSKYLQCEQIILLKIKNIWEIMFIGIYFHDHMFPSPVKANYFDSVKD